LAACAASTAGAAHAADIRIVAEEVRQDGLAKTPAVIEVTGKFEDSDGEVFDGRTYGTMRATVYFHSEGGSKASSADCPLPG
jgi:hypothetical protein